MEILTNIILGAILIMREYQNWKDRRDLMDRIMSADFREYKRSEPGRNMPSGKGRMSDEEMAKAELEINK